jgi:hypothetical protein
MKITKMRKTETRKLTQEEVEEEREAMEDFDGGTITVRRSLNSYEENLAKKNELPFVVRTTEVLIIE